MIYFCCCTLHVVEQVMHDQILYVLETGLAHGRGLLLLIAGSQRILQQ
jgi:hypothetical protein